jgi:MFS transporter, OPA family, glycerol-3-phosphate transporter
MKEPEAATLERESASAVGRSEPPGAFRAAQWRMLFLVMFCYLFFYTGRQNFGFAAKGMQEELGLSATQLGLFNATLLAAYGLGQAINGNLSDIFSARHMVALGALFSVALNWGVSLSRSFLVAILCWGVNGYVQAAAWPALTRTVHNWWPRHERGKAMGFYLLAAGFSSSLTFLLCILVIGGMDWRWIFRLPVLLLLLGGAVFFVCARNKPEELGFPALPPEPSEVPATGAVETSLQRYGRVLRSGPFLLACVSIGCESIARWGLLQWVPLHFLGPNW